MTVVLPAIRTASARVSETRSTFRREKASRPLEKRASEGKYRHAGRGLSRPQRAKGLNLLSAVVSRGGQNNECGNQRGRRGASYALSENHYRGGRTGGHCCHCNPEKARGRAKHGCGTV